LLEAMSGPLLQGSQDGVPNLVCSAQALRQVMRHPWTPALPRDRPD
jgi:hypothetical protein